MNGNEICIEMSYNRCFLEGYRIDVFHYDSTDSSCSGKKQYIDNTDTLISCEYTPRQFNCRDNLINQDMNEPIQGDKEQKEYIYSVICCKK